jgi:hypothetical protein
MSFYVLDDNKRPIECTIEEYSTFNRNIKKTSKGDILVSTVFLGMDSYVGGMFETIVFGVSEEYCARCGTYEEALIQHSKACKEFGLWIPINQIWKELNEA